MKVLIISSLYYPNGIGGAEKNTQVVAEEFASRNIEVVVVTTSDRDYVDFVNGVKVCYVRTRNLYWGLHSKYQNKYKKPLWHLLDAYNPLIAPKIDEIIRREKPDVAQTNALSGFSAAVWQSLKKYNIPILHILHDHYLLCLKTNMFSNNMNCPGQCLPCKLLSVPKRKLSGLVDSVAGVSSYILNRHLDYGFFGNARFKITLPNVFDISQHQAKPVSDKLKFGFVGLLSPGKGIEFLLQYFADLKDTSLLVFGRAETPEYENQLKIKYKDTNIKFMGYNSDLKEVYSTFNVLIIPSLWNETAGRVVIEANSYGLPVIASNRGGIAEFVEDGETGFVFNPDEPGELVKTVKWFMNNNDRIAAMSGKCLQKAQEFSKDKVIEKYINAHIDLLK